MCAYSGEYGSLHEEAFTLEKSTMANDPCLPLLYYKSHPTCIRLRVVSIVLKVSLYGSTVNLLEIYNGK